MGTFNTLAALLTCPRCGKQGEMEIELRHGNTANQLHLKLGDDYPRMLREPVSTADQLGAAPLLVEGYCECHLCQKDFFVTVALENNRLTSAQVDLIKPGHVPD